MHTAGSSEAAVTSAGRVQTRLRLLLDVNSFILAVLTTDRLLASERLIA